jgi:hypothetical protein
MLLRISGQFIVLLVGRGREGVMDVLRVYGDCLVFQFAIGNFKFSICDPFIITVRRPHLW